MIRSDEHGRILLGTEESPITTYAINAAGWIEAMLRAESVAAWESAAESRHLLNRVTLDDGAEVLVPAEHVHIAGPIYPVITPAVLDEEGNIVTNAVTDPRPHYNLRIGPWAQETLADDGVTPRWQETVLLWMQNGAPIDPVEKNKAEDGVKLSGITLIDPTTISSPAMRW
jgi:hypothetical protein